MDIEHLLNAEGIGREALKLGPGERADFLAKRCGNDAKLRAEVEFFLRMHEQPRGTQTAEAPNAAGPGVEVHVQAESPSRNAKLPVSRIGAYRILEQIGQGGFGVVYLAEQEQPVRRRVALKVIKLGMDTPEVLARFEAERQALAMMDHPGVARVFDAGTTEQGRPYFAMEYVPGVPIVEYCDRQRLNNRERLELFVHVCEAIQHAHQKGIIHRDLKPSNILVSIQDERPVPKVIDFGIAKALHQRLTEHTIYTERGQIIGTPEYMSPEQAEMSGLDIDTRTDIYSLGVILYQLLIGSLPFDSAELRKAGMLEIQRVIREQEPPKPSTKLATLAEATRSIAHNRNTDPDTLIRQMRGDLDWITLKAMEKDRTRRYASASELAADVQRYLKDEPVMASPPSAAYRMKKFVRRNRGFVAAATVVSLALVAGFGLASFGLVQARIQRDRAAKERDRAVAAEAEGKRLLALSFARSAELARERGNWATAIENYRQAIRAGHPEPARMRLGVIQCLSAQTEENKLEAELHLLASEPHPNEVSGSILMWQAEVAFKKGQTKRARQMLEEAVRKGIPPAEEAYSRAMLAGTIPETVGYLEKAIEYDPFHHHAVTMLAAGYLLAGQRDRGLEQLAIAVQMFPEDWQLKVPYALMLAMSDRSEDAKRVIELARLRNGESVARTVSELVGVVSELRPQQAEGEKQGDPMREFLGFLERGSRLFTVSGKAAGTTELENVRMPPCIEAMGQLPRAMAMGALGQHKKSAAIFREIAVSVPLGEMRILLANALRRGGRLDEAADEAWLAASENRMLFAPRSLPVRASVSLEGDIAKRDSEGRAFVFRRREQFSRALRALESAGVSGEFCLHAARWAMELGQFELAQELLRNSKMDDAAARLLRAELELARGANGPAVEAAVAALKLDPKSKDGRRLLADATAAMGLVGPRGAGVPVEEYVAANSPGGLRPRRARTASAPAAGE